MRTKELIQVLVNILESLDQNMDTLADVIIKMEGANYDLILNNKRLQEETNRLKELLSVKNSDEFAGKDDET